MSTDSNKIAKGMFWKFGERIIAQLVSFVLSLVLARILTPEDYGVVAMILVFINVANVFVSSGFSSALIQKKHADDLDFSTLFYCSFVISLIVYFILFVCSDYIAEFYSQKSLSLILKVLGLKLIITSYNSIQNAYVSRQMDFKKFFYSTLIGTIISALIGILMAINGFGAWALVAQYLTNTIIDTLVLSFTIHWHPKLMFSFRRAKIMLSFGTKVAGAELIGTIYNEAHSLVIGRFYSPADLAFYNKADQFPKLFSNNILNTVSAVLFPALSKVADKKEQLKLITKKSIRLTCYIMFPIMIGMCVVADPLIRVLLTDKWLPSVIFLQLACISYAILPINNINVQAIKAMGNGNVYLLIEIIKKIIGIILIFLMALISVYAVAISVTAIAFVYLIINTFPNRKLLNYGLGEQLKDILPFAVLTGIMALIVWFIGFVLKLSPLLELIIQAFVGILIYISISKLLKFKEFEFIVDLIKKTLNRTKKGKTITYKEILLNGLKEEKTNEIK